MKGTLQTAMMASQLLFSACAPKYLRDSNGDSTWITETVEQVRVEQVPELGFEGHEGTKRTYKTADGCLVKTVLDVSKPQNDYVITSYYDGCALFPNKEERINYPFKTTPELRQNPRPYADGIIITEYLRDTIGRIIQKKTLWDTDTENPTEYVEGASPADGVIDEISIALYNPETGLRLKTLDGYVRDSVIGKGTINTFTYRDNSEFSLKIENTDFIRNGRLMSEEEGCDRCNGRYDNPIGIYNINIWLTPETDIHVDQTQLYRE